MVSCSRRFLTCAPVARLEQSERLIVTGSMCHEQNDIIEDAGLKFCLILYLLWGGVVRGGAVG